MKVALIDRSGGSVEQKIFEETEYNQFVHLAKKPRVETSKEPKLPKSCDLSNKRVVKEGFEGKQLPLFMFYLFFHFQINPFIKDLQSFLKAYPASDPNSQYTLEFDESNFRECTVVVVRNNFRLEF